MTTSGVTLPPLAIVHTALREITEILACELAAPTDEPPCWGEFEWGIARAVASMQGLSGLLRSRLRWPGPRNWRRFLDDQHAHIAGRQRKIGMLLDRIDSRGRHDGIALVALKGAALHSNGIYQAGERPMADIDLLIQPADLKATVRLLGDCGYELTNSNRRHGTYEAKQCRNSIPVAMGEHVENSVKVELHTCVQEALPIRETNITTMLWPHSARAGINAYPSVVSLMIHLLLHAAGNMRARALRHIQLQDVARLAGRFKSSDWEELLNAGSPDEALWWAVAPLTLTARYHPSVIPQYVIARLSEECPWLLNKVCRRHRLADVSWSNMRVQALPGIEWSRSPLEALSFAIGRIWPSREARLEIQRYDAHTPGASDVPWYGLSQSGRILRWLVSNPPRVQTLLSVRAAFAQCIDEN